MNSYNNLGLLLCNGFGLGCYRCKISETIAHVNIHIGDGHWNSHLQQI